MVRDRYLGMDDEAFEALQKRYARFQETCDDINVEPVKVFKPLTPKMLSELQLIREVSLDLQKKKVEDMNKAAQAAEEAKQAEEKKEENPEGEGEKTEEGKEVQKPETEQ